MSTPSKPDIFNGLEQGLRKHAIEITRFINKWKPIMGLQNWTFDVVFRAENCQDGPGIRARTTARFEYRWAELEFFLPSYWKDGIDGREDTIVHELGHCLVDPLNVDKDAVKMLEMVVTDLAAALLRANREKK